MEHALEADCQPGRIGVGRLHGGDRAPVLEVFSGMSERSRRLRYHGPKPRLREADIQSFVDVGCCGREAVAAVDRVTGAVVGTARYVRDDDDPHTAEIAFEVVDRCQRRGVGGKLLDALGAIARRDGIVRFRALVVPGNEAAFSLLQRAGRVIRSTFADGAHEFVIELDRRSLRAT
jgi:RimJ/RimL family protein N-acetyltransferase